MSALRNLLPSMFHRRLLLLAVVIGVTSCALLGQVVRLAVVSGARHLEEAESVLSFTKLVPTRRGRIVDRKNRVLAEDQPCWDLAVDYEVISGEWAYRQGVRAARRAHREDWDELSFEQQEVLAAAESQPYQRRAEALWQAIVARCDIDRQELERRKRLIIRRVQVVRASVWERRAARRQRATGRDVTLGDIVVPIREEKQAHTLVPALGERAMAFFRKYEEQGGRNRDDDQTFPGLRVLRSRTRMYPLQEAVVDVDRSAFPRPLRQDRPRTIRVRNVYGSLVGTMREVAAEDVDEAAGGRPYRRDDGTTDLKGYLPGDDVGKFGIERAAEWRLRGMRGRETRRRDIEAAVSVEPKRGQDVQLTVDVHLQARMQALLDPVVGLMCVQDWHDNTQLPNLPSGESMPLNGAAIVMEVDTGQVLAMAYSPSASAEGEPGDDISIAPVWPSAADAPGLNRATAAVYPPGSTLKPIVYCIAAAEGVIPADAHFVCEGHLLENHPNKYRCWGWRPERGSYGRHGSIGPVRAIAESCNIYFYSCGRELGAIRLVQGLRRWGYGQSPGMGLDPAEAVPGLLPEPGGVNPAGRGLTLSNAILMGIGQGPISASPLQVANAHAALARGGYWTNPVIMMHLQAEQAGHDLELPPSVVANAWKGMYESSNTQGGTGYRVNYGGGYEKTLDLPGVVTRSKTGTAQTAVKRWIDMNRNGEREPAELFGGTHSWFVCHVGPEGQDRAKYVVVVLVEYGGSGGRVSGPVVNQILYAMRAEGYL